MKWKYCDWCKKRIHWWNPSDNYWNNPDPDNDPTYFHKKCFLKFKETVPLCKRCGYRHPGQHDKV